MNLKAKVGGGVTKLLGRAPPSKPTSLKAAYRKAPTAIQEQDVETGWQQWRDESYWASYANKYMPDLGLGFTVSPWVTAWELIWGATPIQDLAKYKELSQKVPYIYAALMLQANLATSRGFQIRWDGPEEVVDYLQEHVQKHDFRGLFKVVFYDEMRYGSSYFEVVRKFECVSKDYEGDRREEAQAHIEETGHKLVNPYGRITYYKVLDPVYMRVRRNAWGLVLGYIQILTMPPVSFMADEMVHFRFNAMSDQYENAYGNSLLRAMLFHQALLDEFERNMGGIMNTYLKPLLIVKVGSSQAGAPPVTNDQFEAIKSAFKNRMAGTDVYVRQGGLIDDVIVIQPPVQGLQASEWWLRYLQEQREFELGVPRIFGGDSGGINRATAQILLQNFTTRLTNMQEGASEKIENDVFLPLIKEEFSNWEELIERYGIPQLEWNPIVEEDPIQSLSIVSGLAKMGAITYNEARGKLGFSELDEEIYGDMGQKLITLSVGKAEGAGGFATGDQAEEVGTQEKGQALEDLRDLRDMAEVASRNRLSLISEIRKPFEIKYGEWNVKGNR